MLEEGEPAGDAGHGVEDAAEVRGEPSLDDLATMGGENMVRSSAPSST